VKYDYQIPMFEVERKIVEYKNSLTLGVFSPSDLDPARYLSEEVRKFREPIKTLRKLAKQKRLTTKTVAEAIKKDPSIIEAIRLILALPRKIEFRDGRKFPDAKTLSTENPLDLAKLISEMGLWKLILQTNGDVESLLKVALIHSTSVRRSFGAVRNIEKEIEETILSSLSQIKKQVGVDLVIGSGFGA
jgi:hypothetical protein